MALMPRDLKLTEPELTKVAELERIIDRELQRSFIPGKSRYDVIVPMATNPDDRVVGAVIQKYTTGQGAWTKVEYIHNRYEFVLQV